MAAFIVSSLSREIHDIKQQIDTVERRVATLESSTSTVNTRLEALEANRAMYRRHLIVIQLKIHVGNRNKRNNLCLWGIPKANMGADLHSTAMAILNQLLDKAPTAELELDRVQGHQPQQLCLANMAP